MSDTQLYKAQLLEHFKKPRNKAAGNLAELQRVARGSNPSCGDDIEVGFNIVNDIIEPILFRGRGCSVCIASASMMTEVVSGAAPSQAKAIAKQMQLWIAGEEADIPASLQALDAVRHHPARKKCVMLAWNALSEGLEASNG